MTTPRIKLLTLWSGPLPPWFGSFLERLTANPIISWDLIPTDDVDAINRLATATTGIQCCKATPYALCDLRPLFGELYAELYAGHEWWGWCDLDVVFGDLERLLPPLMANHDIIGAENHTVSGPFTILRNTPQTTSLYRREDFREVLTDPEYCNFDESGFAPPGMSNDNPSFTRAVKSSGLRYRFDGRSWAETHDLLDDGTPSRCCELHGRKLAEIPTYRPLLLYHFTRQPKQWPIPNRYAGRLDEQTERYRKFPHPDVPTPTPEESPAYWSARLTRVLAEGLPLHAAVLDTPAGGWDAVQAHTADVLRRYVRRGETVLDAGCGYGALVNVLPPGIGYIGVDYCPEMVALARRLRPGCDFTVADLAELPHPDDLCAWCVCRAVEGSTRTLASNRKWRAMQAEMLRVARRLLLIDASLNHRVVERGGKP